MKYTLKWMAEGAHIMGLNTLGEMANHMHSHYTAYFLLDNFEEEIAAFEAMMVGHEFDSITDYLTADDIRRLNDELDRVLADRAPEPPQGEEPSPDMPVRRVVVPPQDWVTRVTSDHPEQGDDGLHPPTEDDISTTP